MIFYKNMLISTILSVVIFVGIIGYMMYSSKNNQIFPATINDCPDYYDIDSSNNVCIANTNVWNRLTDNTCSSIDFKNGSYKAYRQYPSKKYNAPGKGKFGGVCIKKKKAVSCGITWDGITNDTSICV